MRVWGFSSVVEHLPSNLKALGSVLSSGGKKKREKAKMNNCIQPMRCTEGLIHDQLLFLTIFISIFLSKISNVFP